MSGGESTLYQGCYLLLGMSTQHLSNRHLQLRAGLHLTHSQDSIIFEWSRFLPGCWVTTVIWEKTKLKTLNPELHACFNSSARCVVHQQTLAGSSKAHSLSSAGPLQCQYAHWSFHLLGKGVSYVWFPFQVTPYALLDHAVSPYSGGLCLPYKANHISLCSAPPTQGEPICESFHRSPHWGSSDLRSARPLLGLTRFPNILQYSRYALEALSKQAWLVSMTSQSIFPIKVISARDNGWLHFWCRFGVHATRLTLNTSKCITGSALLAFRIFSPSQSTRHKLVVIN